jgi:hypothetical protein
VPYSVSPAASAGQPLDAEEQRPVVEPPVALGPQGRHQLGDHGAERDDGAGRPGRVEHDAEVLVVQVDPEAGGELAGEHRGALAVQHRAAGQPAAEHPQAGRGIHPAGLQQHDRLGDELDGAGHDELVGGLDELPRPGRPDVHDRRADRRKDRLRSVEVRVRSTDHDGQCALDGALLAAGHRGVQGSDAGRRGDFPGGRRGDRAHVDDQ